LEQTEQIAQRTTSRRAKKDSLFPGLLKREIMARPRHDRGTSILAEECSEALSDTASLSWQSVKALVAAS